MVEYKVHSISGKSNKELEEELNTIGKEDWELIQVIGITYIFKRSVIDKQSNKRVNK